MRLDEGDRVMRLNSFDELSDDLVPLVEETAELSEDGPQRLACLRLPRAIELGNHAIQFLATL